MNNGTKMLSHGPLISLNVKKKKKKSVHMKFMHVNHREESKC